MNEISNEEIQELLERGESLIIKESITRFDWHINTMKNSGVPDAFIGSFMMNILENIMGNMLIRIVASHDIENGLNAFCKHLKIWFENQKAGNMSKLTPNEREYH